MNQKSNLHHRFIEEPNSLPDNTAASYLSETPSLITPFDIYHTDDDSSKQQPNQGFSIELQPRGKSVATSAPVTAQPQQNQVIAEPIQVPILNTQPSIEQITHAMPNTLGALQDHPRLVELEAKIVSGYWIYNLLLCCELVGGMIGLFVVLAVMMYAETMNSLIAVFFLDSAIRTVGCMYAFKARAKFDANYQQAAIICFVLMTLLDVAYSALEIDTYKRFMQQEPAIYRPSYKRFVGGVIMTGVVLLITASVLSYFASKILKLIRERKEIIENASRGIRSVSVQY